MNILKATSLKVKRRFDPYDRIDGMDGDSGLEVYWAVQGDWNRPRFQVQATAEFSHFTGAIHNNLNEGLDEIDVRFKNLYPN